jgi:hypothetical protein
MGCVKIKQKITTLVTNAIILTLNLNLNLMMFVFNPFYFYVLFMGHEKIKLEKYTKITDPLHMGHMSSTMSPFLCQHGIQ